MSIVLVGSTSGSITLQEPAVAGTTVLDLPAVSGTILTTTSPKAGNVIQVVQGTTTTETLFTSATYADAITVSITPSSSSNKILLVTSIFGQANGTTTDAGLRLTRNSTAIATWVEWIRSSNYGGGSGQMAASLNYLDSPATTSAITYRLQVARLGGSDNCFYSTSSSPTTIIAMEIAG